MRPRISLTEVCPAGQGEKKKERKKERKKEKERKRKKERKSEREKETGERANAYERELEG